MNYKVNHPSQDFATALGLDKKQQKRIEDACEKALSEGKAGSMDEAVGLVAPYIKTPEEAFFAAIGLNLMIDAAYNATGIKR